MSNFLKLTLHEEGGFIFINVDAITSLQWWESPRNGKRTIIQTERRSHEVIESPEAILEMIGAMRGN